ncbi:MAG TPA: glycoside hydrolase family 44 protein [Dongiaceae bacterium]|nr:glycoside hydrolase family 44 protein [Dongiaceae bacterium]
MARLRSVPARSIPLCLTLLLAMVFLASCGGNSGSGGSGGGGGTPPTTPSGLTATAGNQQVSLTWTASSGATGYNVKRGTASGGPYSTIASPSANSYTDTSVTNGTTYYYVVSAVNSSGESGNSSQASGTPNAPVSQACNQLLNSLWGNGARANGYVSRAAISNHAMYSPRTAQSVAVAENPVSATGKPSPAGTTGVSVTIDVLKNRHTISPYIYGGAFPKDAPTITDSDLSVVRWGGNATSTYNWKLGTDNADNDWYFEDFAFSALNNSADSDSTQFIKDVQAAGSNPLMTMVMLPCVAQSAETSTQQGGASNNNHWSFPLTSWTSQCGFDPYNSNAGDGLMSDCSTQITAKASDLNNTYFPLLDGPPKAGDPSNSVYRNQWAAALATAFGSTASCPIPYFPSLISCHFYDMDNEIDIWGGTHRDIHPNAAGYDELASTYASQANNLKGWDPAAVRLGPVSCCWWFYWNGANSNDKNAHGGVDFLSWWINQVYWTDQISGARSLDMFDIHAYPDGPDMSNYTQAQKQAMAVSIYRDYWDPTFTSPSSTINQQYTTQIQPNHAIPFRIPRMRAIVNSIYPGTPLAITEWSAEFAGATDFSTALGDADAYGILGRERVSLSTRWVAPDPANPNYQALKLFTNYDGSHSKFGTTSIEATHNADPSLFSVYAALNSSGMTILVLNKDPGSAAQVTFTTTGFSATGTQTAYTLSQSSPNSLVSTAGSWSSTQTFPPYTATLLVVPGSLATPPAVEWDLNPDTIMVPANGSVVLNPTITTGSGTVTLQNAVFDSYEGAAACTGGSIALTTGTITNAANGAITVTAGGTPGFCHFTVTGNDGTPAQTKGGWIVVGNPAATLAPTSGNQSGSAGSQLKVTATLTVGQSGGTSTGASVLFSTSAGTLSNGTASGSKVIAATDSSGAASVTLTFPSTPGQVTVTAEGPFGLGHPVATFTETSQ